ncbi:MAG: 4Fe-4S dicluster domain-containing protein, partial [Deltaproteobacteria bacterium]|nr:4Fe-4S dicluster domain-containing protein [Deltaproteobacteria bacterium]
MKKKPAKKPHKSSQSPGPDIKTEIGQLIRKNNLSLCLECGKCSAVCPMLEFYGEYSYDRYCLTCQECTFFCPSGVIFQDFMTELRECLIDHGYKEYALFCPTCGNYLMPQKEFEYFQKNPDSGKISELLTICPQCKKNNYAETLYRLAPL